MARPQIINGEIVKAYRRLCTKCGQYFDTIDRKRLVCDRHGETKR